MKEDLDALFIVGFVDDARPHKLLLVLVDLRDCDAHISEHSSDLNLAIKSEPVAVFLDVVADVVKDGLAHKVTLHREVDYSLVGKRSPL